MSNELVLDLRIDSQHAAKDIGLIVDAIGAIESAVKKVDAGLVEMFKHLGSAKTISNEFKNALNMSDSLKSLKSYLDNTSGLAKKLLDLASNAKLAKATLAVMVTDWSLKNVERAISLGAQVIEQNKQNKRQAEKYRKSDLKYWRDVKDAMYDYNQFHIKMGTDTISQAGLVLKLNKEIEKAEGDTYRAKINYMRRHKEDFKEILPYMEAGIAKLQIEHNHRTRLTGLYGEHIKQIYQMKNLKLPQYFLDEAAKQQEAEERKRKAREEAYKAWRAEIDQTASSMNLMNDTALKNLNEETGRTIQVLKENESQWGTNAIASENMKKAIQAQMDEYIRLGGKVPPELQKIAKDHKILTSEQEALKRKTDDLKASMGILSDEGAKKLNDETALLVKTIDENASAFENNEAKAKLMKEALQKQLDKYVELGDKVPPELQKLADKYNVVDSKTEDWMKSTEGLNAQYEATRMMIFGMTGTMLPDLGKKTEDAEKKTTGLTDAQKKLASVLGMSEEQFKKFSEVTGEIGGKLSSISGHGKEVLGFLTDTGIVSGETAESLGGLLDGVGQVGAGFMELATNPIGGAMKILGGVVKAVTSIFKLFAGDGVGEAIDREREFIDISEEMEEKIRDLEDKIGDTHAAISLLMDEIIEEADVNANNFEDYARRVNEIVLDLDRGHINLQEFQESMGKSWNALLEEAQNLGMEGSFEMLSIIRNMRDRGMEVAEIQEYVNEQIQAGIDAYNEYLGTFGNVGEITDKIKELEEQLAETAIGTQEYTDLTAELQGQYDLLNEAIVDIGGNFESMKIYAMGMIDALIAEGATFMEIMEAMDTALDTLAQIAIDNGLEVSGALKEMMDLREFINQNEDLVNRISLTIKIMEAFGNTRYLTQQIFDQFQADAQSHFDALIEKTDDAKMAYQLLAPELGKLLWYSQQYGYELDENTKKLIAEADRHGINMKAMIPPQEKMVALLEELVTVLGGEIPYGMDKFREHAARGFGDVGNETRQWARDLEDVEGKLRDDLPAAVKYLDGVYGDAMSGHSIITETAKWKGSLDEVEAILGIDLTDVADKLDAKYKDVLRNMIEKLKETAAEGGDVQASFEEIAEALGLSAESLQELADGPAQQFIQVSEDMQERIDELTETLGDAHAAASTLMADIIKDAEINADNFDTYVQRTREILDDYHAGTLTLQETQEAMGSAFNELLKNARQLGTEGSKEMIALLNDVRASGIEVAEIQQYVNDQLNSGIEAFGNYLGTFGKTGEIKDNIKDLEEQLAKTKEGSEEYNELNARITEQYILLDASISDVTANFDSMGTYALGMFNSLIEEGATFMEAMQAMGPQLTQLAQIAEDNGLQVSGALKDMLDMQDFINQNEDMVTRISATTEMLEALGNTGYLTSEIFNRFQTDAQAQFEELKGKTDDVTQAYQLMGPELGKLAWYASQYGYELDENTKKMIAEAEQHGVNMTAMIPPQEKMVSLMEELVNVLGGKIPYAVENMSDSTAAAFKEVKEETDEWKDELDAVRGKIETDLTGAVDDLDKKYSEAMTGHSIVTETQKWKYSLEDVKRILGRELLETADSLDDKYKHVTGNIYEYLQETSKEGYMVRMSFDQMVNQLNRLKNAYDQLAIKKRTSDKEKNLMADYKRQIQELSEAIEETAPTLENFGKKFKEFQDQLGGDIAVNRGMIEMARGLREQGQSLKEIDDIIDKSLTGGSKGLGAWVNALGPAKKEIDELKKLQEDIDELREQEELKEDELAKLQEMETDILKRRTDAQQLFLKDQEELLNTQDMVVAYFHSLRAEGKGVSEIMEVMGSSFENLANKSMAELTGEAGFEMTEAFSNLYNLQRKMVDNQDLIKGVEGLTDALHGMGDSMLYMSDETFGSFEKSAVTAFEKLKTAGFDQRQSLQLMVPLLKDLGDYSQEYGFSLSKSTRTMLKEAKEEGLIRKKQKTDTEKLIEVNEHLVMVMERMASTFENLGKVSPFAALADEADELQKKTAQMKSFERKQRGIGREIELKETQYEQLKKELELVGEQSPTRTADLQQQMLAKEDEIAQLLRKQENFEKLYMRIKMEVEKLREEYNKNMPGEGDYISAALGYHDILKSDKWFRLHKGEQVDVWTPEETQRIQATPIRRMSLSDTRPSTRGGDIVFEHITIQSENGEEAVKGFMTAIKGNKYGVQNLIRKVAH
jgi:DNA repair exonuclease SbcCD ATPase subunit